MTLVIGNQYNKDAPFKAKARMHQSVYRKDILGVGYNEYGNRLTDNDAKSLLNYYDGLNSRQELRKRYPKYSKKRDADMLRSEHIPFNLIVPLKLDLELARDVLVKAFGIDVKEVVDIQIEYAPEPKGKYLDDATAFDAFISYKNEKGICGIGIEVKYTEQAYQIGKSEAKKVADSNSTYWVVTRDSGQFINGDDKRLGVDEYRQVWRNHLLGLSMASQGDIVDFHSVTLYPSENEHFNKLIPEYQEMLKSEFRTKVIGCSFESFVDAIDDNSEFGEWKEWLKRRYLVG